MLLNVLPESRHDGTIARHPNCKDTKKGCNGKTFSEDYRKFDEK